MALTQIEADTLRAKRKADRINAKVATEAPLFVDQIPKATTEGEYWKRRFMKAHCPSGEAAAELWRVDQRANLWLLRMLAKRVMDPPDFLTAEECSRGIGAGPTDRFWTDVLLGRKRMVLSRDRISHGWRPCFDRAPDPVCCEHGCKRCERR